MIEESGAKQQLVYFVSKVIHKAETRYSHIKKLVYTLVILTRKLRAYFESHPVIIYANYPLK